MFNFKNTSILNFFIWLCQLLKTHFQTLLVDFDAVKNVPILKTNKKNCFIKNKIYKSDETNSKIYKVFQIHKHFILPEMSALFIFIDSFYVYYCNHFQYSDKSMPTLFSHIIFPNELWRVSDVSLFFIFLGSLITYLNLMFGQQIDSKYLMYLFLIKIIKTNVPSFKMDKN